MLCRVGSQNSSSSSRRQRSTSAFRFEATDAPPVGIERGKALEITLDRQVVFEHCSDCDVDFPVVRGSVYDAGELIGLYLIGLHGHTPRGRKAHFALAILDGSCNAPPAYAVALNVVATAEQFEYSAIDWAGSPWPHETYLGKMLDRDEALASSHWPTFIHVAEHLVDDLPEVQAYFA